MACSSATTRRCSAFKLSMRQYCSTLISIPRETNPPSSSLSLLPFIPLSPQTLSLQHSFVFPLQPTTARTKPPPLMGTTTYRGIFSREGKEQEQPKRQTLHDKNTTTTVGVQPTTPLGSVGNELHTLPQSSARAWAKVQPAASA